MNGFHRRATRPGQSDYRREIPGHVLGCVHQSGRTPQQAPSPSSAANGEEQRYESAQPNTTRWTNRYARVIVGRNLLPAFWQATTTCPDPEAGAGIGGASSGAICGPFHGSVQRPGQFQQGAEPVGSFTKTIPRRTCLTLKLSRESDPKRHSRNSFSKMAETTIRGQRSGEFDEKWDWYKNRTCDWSIAMNRERPNDLNYRPWASAGTARDTAERSYQT